MKIEILNEAGYESALFGLGLSYGLTCDKDFIDFCENKEQIKEKMKQVSLKLYNKDGGHNKFLESIMVWVKIDAPLFWYSQLDTYRIGTKQSTSTMHTLLNTPFTQYMFEQPIPNMIINYLEQLRQEKEFKILRSLLPSSFIQTRLCCYSYKTLRNILHQRKNHKLDQWKYFCSYIYKNCKHPEYFYDIMNK